MNARLSLERQAVRALRFRARPITALAIALPLIAGAAAIPALAAPRSTRVEAPIVEVTVHEDRARVVRRGNVDLRAGSNPLLLPDLPGGTWTDTVRVSFDGERIVTLEMRAVERPRSGIETVAAILEEIEALDERIFGLDGRIHSIEQEIAWLGALTPAPLPSAPDAPRALAPAAWPRVLTFIEERQVDSRRRLRELRADRRLVAEERGLARDRLYELDLGGMTTRVTEPSVIVESSTARGRVPVELEYVVPGARWSPVHELHFVPAENAVVLATAGLVSQATGEDWEDARLHLSTATPARGIEMPELLTWVLGEARDFVPAPKRKDSSGATETHAVPRRAAPEMEPRERAELDVLQARLQRMERRTYDLEGVSHGIGSSEAPAAARSGPAPSPRRTPPMPPPKSHSRDYAEEMEMQEMVALSDMSSRRSGQRTSSTAKQQAAARQFSLADPAERLRPAPPRPGSLRAIARGLDVVYSAPVGTTIPASGEQHRVPLYRERFDASVLHETTPGLSETAYLRATVRNERDRPLLGGPVGLFVGGSYTGDGELRTVGPGGEIELPLGADQDVRVRRVVIPETVTTGILRREEATLYTHRIEVANHKARPIRVRITDQIPKTRNENIQIDVESVHPAAAEGPTRTEGIVRWEIEVAAGSSSAVELRYRIRRPVDWRLVQQ